MKFIFRCFAPVLAFIVLLSCLPQSGRAATQQVSIGTLKPVSVDWDPDSYFSGSTTLYRHELCTVSIAMSYLAYSTGEVDAGLSALGMTKVARKFYNKASGDESATTGYTIATRQMTRDGNSCTLIAVFSAATGGTAGGWKSNLDFLPTSGDTTLAKGFTGSAALILDDDDSVYPDMAGASPDLSDVVGGITGDYLIWITGHSRGGGVANYLGKLCVDRYGTSHVSAYTFATPNVKAADLSEAQTGSKYNCIFNIVSPDDIVTYVTMGGYPGWSYDRYGVDLTLNTYTLVNAALQTEVSNQYTYLRDEPYYYFGQPGSLGSPSDADGAAVRAIVAELATNFAPTPWDYYNTPASAYKASSAVLPNDSFLIRYTALGIVPFDLVTQYCALIAGGEYGLSDIEDAIMLLKGCYYKDCQYRPLVRFAAKYALRESDFDSFTYDLIQNYILEGEISLTTYEVATAHRAENYLAWLLSGSAAEVLRISTVSSGDVDGNGEVNDIDRTVLARYLAGWAGYKISESAADVNADGFVTDIDRTILARHLAGWLGYETLPY